MANPPEHSDSDPRFIAANYGFCKKISHIIIFLTGTFLAYVTPSVADSAEIVATIPPLAGIVQMLDQESRITCLLSAGSDPHHFQLSPRQVERLKQATLLIRSSKDDHGWLKLPSDVPAIDLWPQQDHAWLDPEHVQNILPRLAEKLISTSPQKRDAIMENLKAAQKRVASLNGELSHIMESLKTGGIVMQHPSWRTLFKRFGIPVLTTLESHRHGHEHGPRHLEEALNILKQHPEAVLVGDQQHSNRSLQWLSEHHNRKEILYLDALGSCGDTWPTLMRKNITRIRSR